VPHSVAHFPNVADPLDIRPPWVVIITPILLLLLVRLHHSYHRSADVVLVGAAAAGRRGRRGPRCRRAAAARRDDDDDDDDAVHQSSWIAACKSRNRLESGVVVEETYCDIVCKNVHVVIVRKVMLDLFSSLVVGFNDFFVFF
jgi:hypothetical protein